MDKSSSTSPSKGSDAEPQNDGLLSRFKLVTRSYHLTEVCDDDQHKSCENPECECGCHNE